VALDLLLRPHSHWDRPYESTGVAQFYILALGAKLASDMPVRNNVNLKFESLYRYTLQDTKLKYSDFG
jgi:hypothetical protein